MEVKIHEQLDCWVKINYEKNDIFNHLFIYHVTIDNFKLIDVRLKIHLKKLFIITLVKLRFFNNMISY